MSANVIIVFALVLVAIVLFAWERVSFDVTAVIIMATLMLSGILTPEEGLAGLSNAATVTIGAMFILSEGLRRTGALSVVGDYFAQLALLFLEARFFCKFLPRTSRPRTLSLDLLLVQTGFFPCAGRAFARALSLARRTGAAMDQQEKPPPLQKKQREARNSRRPRLGDQSKSPIAPRAERAP